MNVEILHLLEGARRARGVAVIIDVFRAYTVECVAMARGAKRILPVATIEEARALKAAEPDALLAGERGGWMCEGFDCGNSPSRLAALDVRGRTVIHTTSAGTQGAAAAAGAEVVLGGALVNARATARYIRRLQPEHVSLVAMGLSGRTPTDEDELCAAYMKALLCGEPFCFGDRLEALRETTGRKFFDPGLQEAFPQADFDMCIQVDRYDAVLRMDRQADGFCKIGRAHV